MFEVVRSREMWHSFYRVTLIAELVELAPMQYICGEA